MNFSLKIIKILIHCTFFIQGIAFFIEINYLFFVKITQFPIIIKNQCSNVCKFQKKRNLTINFVKILAPYQMFNKCFYY